MTTPYRAWLRGKLSQAGLLDERERRLYADPALETRLLVAYTLGSTSNPDAMMSEVEVGAAVAALLAATDPRAADPMVERAYNLIDPDDLAIKITAEEVVISGRPLPHVQLDPERAFRHVCGSPDACATQSDPGQSIPAEDAPVQGQS